MNIAVFVSGRGSNMEALLSAAERGEISSKISLVFSDNENSKALETARSQGIPAVFERRPDGAFLLELLKKYGIEAIVLAGYLKMIPPEVVEKYDGRIINIHPSLLPRFGGKGFYGMNVHRAVLEDMLSEMRESTSGLDSGGGSALGGGAHAAPYYSGATVHFVDSEYDRGEVLIQAKVDISDLASAEDIAARVLRLEHKIIVEGVRLLEERSIYAQGAD